MNIWFLTTKLKLIINSIPSYCTLIRYFITKDCVIAANIPKVTIQSTVKERTTRYRSLLLKYFDWPRHPLKNTENWLDARSGIVNELEQILKKVPNVAMKKQSFQTEILYRHNEPTPVNGQNIIVTFHGRNRGTVDDGILLIGAHYDSENLRLFSVNDNGSGVVAIMECVRSLSDTIVNQGAILLNTVIFVLFDVQRSQYVRLLLSLLNRI